VCTFQCMQVWSDRLDHYSALRPTYLSKQQANPNDFLLPLRTCSLLLMTYQRKADVWRSACMVTRNFNMPKLGNALSASHSVRNKPNEEFRVELSSVCFSKPSLLHLCICRYCRMSAIAQKAARCGVVWRGVAWCGAVWRGVARCGVAWCPPTAVIRPAPRGHADKHPTNAALVY